MLFIDSNNKVAVPDSVDFFNNIIIYTQKLPKDTIYDKARQETRDSAFAYIYSLLHHTKGGLGFSGRFYSHFTGAMTTSDDGSIWFGLFSLGILRYKPSDVSVSDSWKLSDEVLVYPQPILLNNLKLKISFSSPVEFSALQIFDILGKKFLQKK